MIAKIHSIACRALLGFGCLAILAQPALSQWPQYRGPRVDGSAELEGYDAKLIDLDVAWRVELGSGYSGIAVADGRAVTMFSHGESDYLAAFEVDSGQRLWRYEIGPVYRGHDGSHDGPRSTPAIVDQRVIALSPRGRLFAVTAETGALIWSKDLGAEYGAVSPFYGSASSPIKAGNNIVIHLGADDAMVAAFDPATGQQTWFSAQDGVGYQSALPWSGGPPTTLIAAGNSVLYGLSAKDGRALWQYEHGGDGGEYGGGSLTPVPAGDGRLFLSHKHDASAVVRLTTTGGEMSIQEIWENRVVRHSYDVPVFLQGHIYAYSSRFLVCLDAATGDVQWRSRQPGDGFIGRLGEFLVMQTKSGSLHLAKAEPEEYQELDSVEVFSDHSWTAPSFADESIYVRSFGELARVDIAAVEESVARGRQPADEQGRIVEGTRFAELLEEVGQTENKAEVVDRFLGRVESFPVLESDNRVVFVYRGEGDDLALAGDWIGVAAEEPMTRVERTDLFYYVAKFEPGTRVSYRFIRDYEEILDPRSPRQAEIAVVGEDMEVNFSGESVPVSWVALKDWRKPHFIEPFEGDDKGRMTTLELEGESADETLVLEIYLPAGYDDSERRYPVLYVLDGQNALRIGHYQNALDHLISEGAAGPLIAVFMPRLPWWGQDLDRGLQETLIPSVDRELRTLDRPQSRVMLGSSGYAQVALRFVLVNPEIAAKAALHSGHIFETLWDRLLPLIRTPAEQPIRIYHDWGRYDLQSPHENWILRDSNHRIFEYFRARGWDVRGGEVADGAGWPAWRNRTDALLTALFPPDKTIDSGSQE